jgi:prophage antirepressor-like protein
LENFKTSKEDRVMNDIVKVFENDIFNLAVKLENGKWVFDAERVAINLGISRTAESGNKVVRWDRVNKYLSSYPQVGTIKKGDFIPEPAIYKLAFKASNDIAEKFQDWLAIEVLPQLRKTGEYKLINKNNEEISFEEKMKQLKMEQSQLAFIMDRMHLSQASEIKMLRDFNESEGLSTSYLNISTDEREGISATNLLKQFSIPMSTIKFNKLMERYGYMEKRKRKSTNERGYKVYNVIIGEGLRYGKNVINSSGSEKETQPLYYESTFMELIDLILPSKDRRCS